MNAAWLEDIIDATDAIIKKWCKRNLESANYTEYYSGSDRPELVLRQRPVTAVTAVYMDPTGFWGQGANAFPSSTLMTAGTHYALVLDDGGNQSTCGVLMRIGGTGPGFPGTYPDQWMGGKLAAYRLPRWQRGQGNIKIQYTAGYTTVPEDLANAATQIAAYLVRNMPSGMPLTSEGLGAYNYSIQSGLDVGTVPELGGAGMTLRRYREVSVGVGF
jgi:hypothetical protein